MQQVLLYIMIPTAAVVAFCAIMLSIAKKQTPNETASEKQVQNQKIAKSEAPKTSGSMRSIWNVGWKIGMLLALIGILLSVCLGLLTVSAVFAFIHELDLLILGSWMQVLAVLAIMAVAAFLFKSKPLLRFFEVCASIVLLICIFSTADHLASVIGRHVPSTAEAGAASAPVYEARAQNPIPRQVATPALIFAPVSGVATAEWSQPVMMPAPGLSEHYVGLAQERCSYGSTQPKKDEDWTTVCTAPHIMWLSFKSLNGNDTPYTIIFDPA